MAPEPVYEVETIKKAKWSKGEWRYLVKWHGYSEKSNTWEPGSSLRACAWMLGQFWRDAGMENLGYSATRAEGYTLTSTTEFREDLCKARIEQEDSDDPDTGGIDMGASSIVSDAGKEIPIPDLCLLWIDPECIGLTLLTANERYQIVLCSLEAKGIDASTVLYKKVKNDTKDDSAWLANWGNGCVICCADEKALNGLLSCHCRQKAYCIECLRSLALDPEGRVSCPFCRAAVYVVSRSWVLLTPEEEELRKKKRAVEKAERRKRNKANKLAKKLQSRLHSPQAEDGGPKPPAMENPQRDTFAAIQRVRLVVANDRLSQIKRNVSQLAMNGPSLQSRDAFIHAYHARYMTSDATDVEILTYLS